jgi:hypothetical protein
VASTALGLALGYLRAQYDQWTTERQQAALEPSILAALEARLPDAMQMAADEPELEVYFNIAVRVSQTGTFEGPGIGTIWDPPFVTLDPVSLTYAPRSGSTRGTTPHLSFQERWTVSTSSVSLSELLAEPEAPLPPDLGTRL